MIIRPQGTHVPGTVVEVTVPGGRLSPWTGERGPGASLPSSADT